MKKLSFLPAILFASVASAASWQHSYDVPVKTACATLTVRQCMLLSDDLGVNDDSCYNLPSQAVKLGYSQNDCLAGRAQLRDILRQRLEGTLPTAAATPVPQWAVPQLNAMTRSKAAMTKLLGVPASAQTASSGEQVCVTGPSGAADCLALPSDAELDKPVFPANGP